MKSRKTKKVFNVILFLIIVTICGYFIKFSLSTFIAQVKSSEKLDFFIKDSLQVRRLFQEFNQKIKSKDATVEDYFRLATLYAKRKDWIRSRGYYNKAIEIDPYYIKAYNNLGNVYFHLNKLDEAIECYKIASRISSDYLNTRINLGLAYLKKGFIKEAILQWDYVLQKDPSNQDALIYRKWIYK